jgi:lipopolysaccharide biosynthesis glycosyltransferase
VFDVLFEFEKRIDTKLYSEHRRRIIGFCGEQLYGIWLSYVKATSQIKIEERQLVFIKETKKHPELFPAFPQNNIPIVVTCSDYYAPYLSVFITALMKNSRPSRNYDLIVLVKGISEEAERRLRNQAANYSNLSLRFFNPKKMLSGMQFYVSGSVNAEEANYRLLTPWILKNYSKAIVTDIDLIFRTDPANLYEGTELENKCLACCKDVIYQGALNDPAIDALEYAKKTLKLKNPYDYVNTGVMLMNLDEIRKVFKLEELLDFSQKNHFRIQEQDILNVLFEGRILFLDISWNCYLIVNNWVERELFFAPAPAQKDYSDAFKNAKVLHWASQPKPWASPELLYADNWWYYAKESPFYEVLIKRLNAPQEIHTLSKPSFARRFADVYLPSGSWRRKIAKKILPRNSKRWNLLKAIYYKYLNV